MDSTLTRERPKAFDYSALLERCMGSTQLATRLVMRFHEVFQSDIEKLDRSCAEGDAAEIARIAHHLKGTAANLSADGVSSKAAEIERLGRAENVTEVGFHLHQLRDEWYRFVEALPSSEVVNDLGVLTSSQDK